MPELIKPKKENQFWDTSCIMHNKTKLSTVLNSKLNTSDIKTNLSGNETNKVPSVSAVNNIVSDILKKAYPVGSIYMSVNSTSPATLFGGTWVELQGRFLLGRSSSYSAGSTGGEATHKLTVNEIPSHDHAVKIAYPFSAGGVRPYVPYANTDQTYMTGPYDVVQKTGGDQSHNNMPPYLSVYMWKRTA